MMRTRYLVGLFFVVSLVGALLNQGKERTRRLDMALNAYQSGCYDTAKIACAHTYTEKDLYNCYEEALEYCPTNAKAFRDWIANGSKK